jgi:LSD1 subclass zinc finger protein
MSIQARCPSCRNPVKVPDIAAGRNVRCPKCYASITIPGSNYSSGSAIRRIKSIFGIK